MANLTPEQVRAAKARGADVTVTPKVVSVSGLLDHLQTMANNQIRLMESLDKIVAAIADKEVESESMDLSGLTEAVLSLRDVAMLEKREESRTSWQLDFERDQRTGLMKSGATFSPVPKRLDS